MGGPTHILGLYTHLGLAPPELMHLHPVVWQHFSVEQSFAVVLAQRSRSFPTACQFGWVASISAKVSVSSTEADVWYDVPCSAAPTRKRSIVAAPAPWAHWE